MKKGLCYTLAAVTPVLAVFLTAGPASAQASRTWISGVGDDANPCSRTAPCKTFAGAISKTAVNGEIDCLDPGGFGAVTITKSITLNCHATLGSILNAGTNAINIAFDSFADARKTVNIRDLDIQGFDQGIIGIHIFGNGAGSEVTIQDSVINGNFGGGASGIVDNRASGQLNVINTTVRNMGAHGIQMAPVAMGLLELTLNNVKVVNTGTGLSIAPGVAGHVTRSAFSSNTTTGIANSGGGLNIDSSTIAFNGTGIAVTGGSVNLSNTDLSFNSTGTTGTINSYSNNRFSNNGALGTITPIGSASNPTGQK